MQCPVCPDTTLSMSSRQGIEIDYCPKCRGVWLDRGELDKIIERSAADSAVAAPPAAQAAPSQPYPPAGLQQRSGDYRRDHDDYYRKQEKYGKYGKRKSLLGELFDF